MKRAKIMLLAIAVIATVGGALAFKAQRFIDKNIYCATFKAGGGITCTFTDYKTTADATPSTTMPCKAWHQAVFGVNAVTTTSYYTTTTCPLPLHTTGYLTVIQ